MREGVRNRLFKRSVEHHRMGHRLFKPPKNLASWSETGHRPRLRGAQLKPPHFTDRHSINISLSAVEGRGRNHRGGAAWGSQAGTTERLGQVASRRQTSV